MPVGTRPKKITEYAMWYDQQNPVQKKSKKKKTKQNKRQTLHVKITLQRRSIENLSRWGKLNTHGHD